MTSAPYNTIADADKAGSVIIKYGVFINTVVSFVIISFSVFLIIEQLNRLKREEHASAPPAAPTEEIALLEEIKDLLKKDSPQ